MPCAEVKSSKYQTRKSPAFHAKDCKDLVKKGKDGNYASKPDSKGIYKWVKTKGAQKGVTRKIKGNSDSVWGKNPALERFWRGLASGKKVVLIYKNGTHKDVNLPNIRTPKYQEVIAKFNQDAEIVAILSSNMSQDAYERFLYPKARNNSVEHVIKNYKKYFGPMDPGSTDKTRVPK